MCGSCIQNLASYLTTRIRDVDDRYSRVFGLSMGHCQCYEPLWCRQKGFGASGLLWRGSIDCDDATDGSKRSARLGFPVLFKNQP